MREGSGACARKHRSFRSRDVSLRRLGTYAGERRRFFCGRSQAYSAVRPALRRGALTTGPGRRLRPPAGVRELRGLTKNRRARGAGRPDRRTGTDGSVVARRSAPSPRLLDGLSDIAGLTTTARSGRRTRALGHLSETPLPSRERVRARGRFRMRRDRERRARRPILKRPLIRPPLRSGHLLPRGEKGRRRRRFRACPGLEPGPIRAKLSANGGAGGSALSACVAVMGPGPRPGPAWRERRLTRLRTPRRRPLP